MKVTKISKNSYQIVVDNAVWIIQAGMDQDKGSLDILLQTSRLDAIVVKAFSSNHIAIKPESSI